MSYHQLPICKHQIGSPWKITEELYEYIDAVATENPIMAIQELSDLYGAIEEEAKKYGITMDNLKTMSDLTKNVFKEGHRTNTTLYDDIKNNANKIGFIDENAIAFMPNDFAYIFVKDGQSYSNDLIHSKIVIETVKGSCRVTDGSNKDDHLKLDVKMSILDSKDSEIYFSDNTIIKIKAFEGYLLSNDFEQDNEALQLIKQVCEGTESNE